MNRSKPKFYNYYPQHSIAKIIKRLESDNAISIIENLNKEKDSVLDKLPPKDRFLLEEGLSYPEEAARIMQREFTAVPSDWSVGQTIDYIIYDDNDYIVINKPRGIVKIFTLY